MKTLAIMAVMGQVLTLLVPANAHAGQQTPKPTSTPPHECGAFYPRGETGSAEVQVSFTITANGQVSNPIVTKTSNYGIFDVAALRCVSEWSYQPATRDGKPIEISWRVHVVLNNPTSASTTATPPIAVQAPPANQKPQPEAILVPPHVIGTRPCATYYYPREAMRLHMEGWTELLVTVSAAGSVVNSKLVQSSGSPLLDAASITCITSWQFKPGLINGAPIEAAKRYKIGWRITNRKL